MMELLREAWIIFAEEWGRSCLLFGGATFFVSIYEGHLYAQNLRVNLFSTLKGAMAGIIITVPYLLFTAYQSLLEKERNKNVELERRIESQITRIGALRQFLNLKIDQTQHLVGNPHQHNIAATLKWHQEVCQAIKTALGEETERMFKAFPRAQQLASTGTINGQCMACSALQDVRIILADLEDKFTETDLLPTLTVHHFKEFEGKYSECGDGARH